VQDSLRQLPSVDELVRRLEGIAPRALLVAEARSAIEAARRRGLKGEEAGDPEAEARRNLEGLARSSLRRVINATGVILHTNLGRAPLPALAAAGPYSNLEYDLNAGRRGRRDTHTGALLERLLERKAIAVNNGAAAVYLALHELAGDGGEVIVSRGELIEIGDGFRIPDIMAHSGARLVEVGTTNRTRIEDYESAITERTRLLLRVHPSNFRMEGFTGKPELEELSALGRKRGIPLYEDLGSGCLLDLAPWGVREPTVRESFRGGVDLVSFSGDKLLGGPQAGVLAGRDDIVERLRRNPMFRALRLDKLAVQALETTLRHIVWEQWDALPAYRMVRRTAEEIGESAARVFAGLDAEIIAGESLLGGGSTPEQTLPTRLGWIKGDAGKLEERLRSGDPPVIARIEDGKLLLDLRTVSAEEEPELRRAVELALSGQARST
jgi:L-seryl-tRNA(Ser) seleniumtransferase